MPTENKQAEPLSIERSTVTKLVITGAQGLDPITVFLEDLAPRKGKITVSCWDKSWHAYWGGMWDGHTLAQFFCRLDEHYIIGYFSPSMGAMRFSNDALMKLARKAVVDRRRMRKGYWEFGDSLDSENARDLFDQIDDLRNIESITNAHQHGELLTDLFGADWWHVVDDKAIEPIPLGTTCVGSSRSYKRLWAINNSRWRHEAHLPQRSHDQHAGPELPPLPHHCSQPARGRAHRRQPRRIHPDPGTWSECMRRDIKALMDCDTVATLPGWQDSRGASLEVHIGKELGMKIVNAHDLVLSHAIRL